MKVMLSAGQTLTNVTSITARGSNSAVQMLEDPNSTKQAYQVYIWGNNANGQLMNGDASVSTSAYAKLTSFSDKTSITNPYPQFTNYTQSAFFTGLGYRHTAIVGIDGYVYSAGYNYYGQLGNGVNTDSAYPVRSGVREEDILIYNSGNTSTISNGETVEEMSWPMVSGH